jgi:hypothetical protein
VDFPLTLFGWPLSDGGGLFPEQDSDPTIVLPETRDGPVPPVSDTEPLIVDPDRPTPAAPLALTPPVTVEPAIDRPPPELTVIAPFCDAPGPMHTNWPLPATICPVWLPVIDVVHPPTVTDSLAVAVCRGLAESAAWTVTG